MTIWQFLDRNSSGGGGDRRDYPSNDRRDARSDWKTPSDRGSAKGVHGRVFTDMFSYLRILHNVCRPLVEKLYINIDFLNFKLPMHM